ncbi:hypothetical protein [Terriglobus albidus]|uniref:hypothetical protein n=1 Tax=Terriglobus albidus TaxID=1592106 RepID=UPI0021E0BE7B|nr:hypothetical protein [Terriglobus albidus]
MNRPLQEALSSLRQEHQEIAAPDSIKRDLVMLVKAGVDSNRSQQGSWFRVAALGAAVAACMAAGIFYRYQAAPALPVRPVAPAIVPDVPLVATAPQQQSASHVSKGPSPVLHRRARQRAAAVPAVNGTTDPFIALPSSEGLPAPSMATLVRMQIRRDELRQYGFDVSPADASEMVLAEFVVGQDGLSRAVRFVR